MFLLIASEIKAKEIKIPNLIFCRVKYKQGNSFHLDIRTLGFRPLAQTLDTKIDAKLTLCKCKGYRTTIPRDYNVSGARFSKDPVSYRGRYLILKSKSREK